MFNLHRSGAFNGLAGKFQETLGKLRDSKPMQLQKLRRQALALADRQLTGAQRAAKPVAQP